MSAYEKPSLSMSEIETVLRNCLGPGAVDIMPLTGGSWSTVFSFNFEGKGYVVKFSDLKGAYETERFVSHLLTNHGIPFPKCLAQGNFGRLAYVILDRMDGRNLSDCSAEEQIHQLPELIGIISKLAEVDVSATNGYGLIGPDGNGGYASWKDYVVAVNAEDQTGTVWENWHELFRTTCLERDVFEEIYSRLTTYLPYNEAHRGFLHGDFHQWNTLSDGIQITGIIDGNCMYGDSLVDLAVLDRHMSWGGVIEAYQDHQAKVGISVPNFKERLLGAYYFKGLDGLRFYAKMGWEDDYKEIRDFLLNLES